jgi:hypothetical protein
MVVQPAQKDLMRDFGQVFRVLGQHQVEAARGAILGTGTTDKLAVEIADISLLVREAQFDELVNPPRAGFDLLLIISLSDLV